MVPESVAVTLLVTETLEKLGVRYYIGGSFASTVHGQVRTTLDTDIVAELRARHVTPLLQALGQAFYADEPAIRAAIAHRRSFNLIHLATAFRVAVFVARKRAFDRAQLERRVRHVVIVAPRRTAYVATAEDVVLAKLEGYRLGGGVSERQWGDVLGVIGAQGARLDLPYLRGWAARLGVAGLLERALAEGGA